MWPVLGTFFCFSSFLVLLLFTFISVIVIIHICINLGHSILSLDLKEIFEKELKPLSGGNKRLKDIIVLFFKGVEISHFQLIWKGKWKFSPFFIIIIILKHFRTGKRNNRNKISRWHFNFHSDFGKFRERRTWKPKKN